ncbi:MAG TPA: sn-glycerol-3-phosphate ABC transporter ATP-binding protein UgpC [Candidatus Eisenbacteria bacterium]
MAGVSFTRVTKQFGTTTVIHELDLDVRDEELMVLVGPSGCGKSTALRMLAGLEEVTGGEIRIGDRVVNDLPPKDRDIAMVFQSYALYPHMSVRENMAFGLRIRKMPKAEIDRLVTEAARTLGIDHLLDRKPKALSGGQRQRVAVGRAIVRKPSVFLFDEPLSNLDAKLRVQMRAEITKLQQTLRTTTIYVTHDQVEAMTMGTRIAVLKDGALQQVGSPLEVYERPRNVFVATFIGTPPMNFIPGEIEGGGASLRATGFSLPLAGPQAALAARSVGGRVLAGLRPEHLHVADGAVPTGRHRLEADVDMVELLGNEAVVHARIGDIVLVAKADSQGAPRSGARVSLDLELDALHLFDAETEQRLES